MDLMLDVGFIPSSDFPVTAASRLLLINEIRQFNPYWIEEAVYPDDYEGYKMLAERTDVRIAGGETRQHVMALSSSSKNANWISCSPTSQDAAA